MQTWRTERKLQPGIKQYGNVNVSDLTRLCISSYRIVFDLVCIAFHVSIDLFIH